MTSHSEFRVGQIVGLQSAGAGNAAPDLAYKIVRRLPRATGEQFYLIKTIMEPFVRMVRDVELRMDPMVLARPRKYPSSRLV